MSDVLKVTPTARIKLTKNTNKVLFDQAFQPSPLDFSKMAGQVVSIAAGGSLTLDIAGITAVRQAMVSVDLAANLKVNASPTVLPLKASGCFFAANASITSIKVLNPSATYTLTVNYGVTD